MLKRSGLALLFLALLGTSATLVQGEEPAAAAEPNVQVVRPGDAALSAELAKKIEGRMSNGVGTEGTTPITIAQAQGIARAPLTDDSLREVLENLGYPTTKVELVGGRKASQIKITRGTWEVFLRINLSGDSSHLWFNMNLTVLSDPAKVNGLKALDLLRLSKELGPNHFEYVPKQKLLMLCRAESNSNGLSPKDLRVCIDQVVDDGIATYPQWSTLEKAADGAPAAAAPSTIVPAPVPGPN